MIIDKSAFMSGQSFHIFVASVLRQIAVEEQKDILFEVPLSNDIVNSKVQRYDEFDAIAPNGLSGLVGPVIFEFKHNLNPSSITKILSSLYRKIERASVYSELTVVLITNSSYKDQFFDVYKGLNKKEDQSNITTQIWGGDILQKWISQYPIDFSNAISQYEVLRKADNVSSDISKEDFDEKSLNNVKAIKRIIQSEDSFALVLGAGVSVDPGAKSWNELLKYFENELVKSGVITDSNKLCDKIGGSSIITAQLCKELYKYESDFFWAIHEGLYLGRKALNPNFALSHVANIIMKCVHN